MLLLPSSIVRLPRSFFDVCFARYPVCALIPTAGNDRLMSKDASRDPYIEPPAVNSNGRANDLRLFCPLVTVTVTCPSTLMAARIIRVSRLPFSLP
jgi:hypothetical protein